MFPASDQESFFFPKKTWFLLVRNGIWGPQVYLGSRDTRHSWVCHRFSAFSAGAARARMLFHVHMTCVCFLRYNAS